MRDATGTRHPGAGPLAWDDVRLVSAVATARTLPAAARQLGLDHSTVFRRLRRIEAALGTALFERHRGGYVPTEAGSELAALASRVDEDVTTVLRRVAGRSPGPAGEVRIATSDALLTDLLLPVLAAFRRACPEVRLDLVTGNVALNLSRRDADVAVRATATPPETLVGRKVARIAWGAYATRDHAAAQAPDADPFAADAPWIGFGDALADLAAAAHLRARVDEGRLACRLDTVGGLAAAAEAGIGIALLPCFAGDRRPALLRLGSPVASLATDLWLLTHADLRTVPRVRVLMDFVAERMAALRQLTEGLGAPRQA